MASGARTRQADEGLAMRAVGVGGELDGAGGTVGISRL